MTHSIGLHPKSCEACGKMVDRPHVVRQVRLDTRYSVHVEEAKVYCESCCPDCKTKVA